MLYVKTTNPDGTLTFAPVRSDNVCQYCTTCGREDGYCREHYPQNYPEYRRLIF